MRAVVCVLVTLLVLQCSANLGCLNPKGQHVDWWVILKAPYLSTNSNPAAKSGYAFSYADSANPTLTYTNLQLNSDQTSGLAWTLDQIYNTSIPNVGYIMYNDEFPNGNTYSNYGHTKGVVGFDNNAGFWLIHSTPRWPNPPPSTYQYPDNEKTYGQSFLCMTFGLSTFNTIGQQFLLNKPAVYASYMNSVQTSALPNMANVLAKKWNTPAGSNIATITSSGGVSLRTFAKNSAWNQSLYEDLVEPSYKSGFLWETWQNGSGGKMPSFCTPQYAYDSVNILSIQLTPSITWSETQDHSKYGVSQDISNIVCIGDINRVYSQNQRGGGTYCFSNSKLYTSFKGLISNAAYCT